MTEDVIGLPLEEALQILSRAGIDAPAVTESRAPRGIMSRGTLRVTRVTDGGHALLVSRFPDTIEECAIEFSAAGEYTDHEEA